MYVPKRFASAASNRFNLITLAILSQVSPAMANDDISWQNDAIGVPAALALGLTGSGTTIGIIDNGFLDDHPALANPNLHPLKNTAVINGDTLEFDPNDSHSTSFHGASVTGVISALPVPQWNFEGGIAKQAAVYYTTSTPLSDDDDDDGDEDDGATGASPWLFSSELQGAFAQAFSNLVHNAPGLRVINNSWNNDPLGDRPEDADRAYQLAMESAKGQTLLADAMREAASRDVLMVFAAGNESHAQPGLMATLPRYMPELESHMLSVAALDQSGGLASYSNQCGVSKAWCISAPGDMWVADKEKGESVLINESGTSFAAPLVTGAAALLKERFGYMSMGQVRDVMLTTATSLDGERVSERYGWGLLNLESAVKGPQQLRGDETYTLAADSQDSWSNSLAAGGRLTKAGDGSLTLDGAHNRLAALRVEGGRLTLGHDTWLTQASEVRRGELRVSGTLQGPSLRVEQPATLSGGGTVLAGTRIQGTLATGTAPGEGLSFRDHLVLEHGSTTRISNSSGIHMAGQQALAELGGTLQVVPASSRATSSQTVLTTEDGARYSGRFDVLQQDTGLLAQGLRNDLFFGQDRISVGIHARSLPGQDQLSHNAQAGAELLNSLRDTPLALGRSGYNSWLHQALTSGNLNGLERRIGGQVHADALSYLLQQPQRLQDDLLAQLGQADRLSDNTHLWLEHRNRDLRHDAVSGIDASKENTRSVQLGLTRAIDSQRAVAGSFSRSDAKVSGNAARVEAEITQMSLGGRYALDSLNVGPFIGGQINVGYVDMNSRRDLGPLGSAKADSSGWLYSAGVHGGYRWQGDALFVEPRLGLKTSRVDVKGFTEKGSEANLKLGDRHLGSTSAQFDLSVGHQHRLGDWTLAPSAAVGYQRLLSGDQPSQWAETEGLGVRQVSAGQGKDRFSGSLGLMASHGPLTLSGTLERTLGGGNHGDSASLNLGIRF